jgi:putative endonuclease
MSRVSGRPYFVYILWSASASRFYTGISEDPDSRLLQHNAGLSKWTSRYPPWELVHVEPYANYSDARKRELALKRQKGGVGFYALTGLDPLRFRNKPTPSGS